MRALRAEPEAEHDRDVGEERERIPVIDRLVEARDALVFRESGHGLRDESPHQRRTDDDGEHRPRQTGGLRTACRREHEPEPEEHGVRDALVERVPAAIADDRPPDRHAGPGHEEDERPDEHRSRATCRGAGSRPNATARSAPTSRTRAAPPTGSVPPTPDPSPANIAPSSAAPTRAARTPAPVPDARSDGSDAESMAGHASSVLRSSRRPAGDAGSPSNNSFTLPTPLAHRAPEDSARPGLRSLPVRTHS